MRERESEQQSVGASACGTCSHEGQLEALCKAVETEPTTTTRRTTTASRKKDEHNSLKFKMDASSVVPTADDGAGQHRIRCQRRKQQ